MDGVEVMGGRGVSNVVMIARQCRRQYGWKEGLVVGSKDEGNGGRGLPTSYERL
jgi:hypothetical protein